MTISPTGRRLTAYTPPFHQIRIRPPGKSRYAELLANYKQGQREIRAAIRILFSTPR